MRVSPKTSKAVAKTVNTEPGDVLFRIKRGLSGYISYLAACEMNEAFNEYMLYEPILRILSACGYQVTIEFPCPGLKKVGPGDQKKIDFHVHGPGSQFAMEVKWARSHKLNVKEDYNKLKSYHCYYKDAQSFLCVFGRKSDIENIELKNGSFAERGKAVYAEFGKTRYGCRMYELKQA
jgi:hypothetical protein